MGETTATRRVKETARAAGADLVGIAPVERFRNAPEGRIPGARRLVRSMPAYLSCPYKKYEKTPAPQRSSRR